MKKFAVFDIDGTLIRWQLYHVIVDRLAKQGLLGKEGYQKIREARMKWKNREASESFYLYEQALVKSYEAGMTNIKTEVFDELVNEVIDEYKDQVYTFTRDLITKLKAQNYFLLAISGSHFELVEKLAQYYGFDDCIGSTYERMGKSFSGKSYIPSFDKATALNQLVEKNSLTIKGSYAIGDSLSDSAMLALVDNPIAFNPDTKLFTTAEENKWKIVVERKNMIYQLEYKDGNYILAKAGQ